MRVEMKVCECCGGLWLRPAAAINIYCPRCAPVMAQIPVKTEPDVAEHQTGGRQ